MRNPEDDLWSPEERESLRQLAMFNVRQPLAVLMAVFEHFGETRREDFSRFLRAISVVSFRYNVICGRQSNEQEAVYNVIARALAPGLLPVIAGVIGQLRQVYPEDAEFRAAFADKELRTTSSRNKKVARYILFAIERRESGREWNVDNAKVTLEHVLPENPGEHWSQIGESEQERLVYRLGNLTLLTAAANRELGSSAFASKRASYAQSELVITQKIAADHEDWTAKAVRDRQNWMARQACAIWQISF